MSTDRTVIARDIAQQLSYIIKAQRAYDIAYAPLREVKANIVLAQMNIKRLMAIHNTQAIEIAAHGGIVLRRVRPGIYHGNDDDEDDNQQHHHHHHQPPPNNGDDRALASAHGMTIAQEDTAVKNISFGELQQSLVDAFRAEYADGAVDAGGLCGSMTEAEEMRAAERAEKLVTAARKHMAHRRERFFKNEEVAYKKEALRVEHTASATAAAPPSLTSSSSSSSSSPSPSTATTSAGLVPPPPVPQSDVQRNNSLIANTQQDGGRLGSTGGVKKTGGRGGCRRSQPLTAWVKKLRSEPSSSASSSSLSTTTNPFVAPPPQLTTSLPPPQPSATATTATANATAITQQHRRQ